MENVYEFKTIDMCGDKQFQTREGLIDLMQAYNRKHENFTREEDSALLEGRWSKLRIGNDEDYFWVLKLDELHLEDRAGNIMPKSELDMFADEEPYDCQQGIDYPASL